MAQADAIITYGLDFQSIINGMPPAFGDALVYLMDDVKVTVEKLAEDALMDSKMIQRMRTNKDYPKTLKSVVTVCIAMHLFPEVSMALIKKSGYSFRLSQSEEHMMYYFFITRYYTHSVKDCNTLLVAKGLPPLADKEYGTEEE